MPTTARQKIHALGSAPASETSSTSPAAEQPPSASSVPAPSAGPVSSNAAGMVPLRATQAAAGTPQRSLPQRCPQRVLPDFPYRALRAGITEGRVELRLHLDTAGAVTTADVLRAEPAGYFETAAREAALRWHCLPAAEAGASVVVPFVFRAQ